MSNTQLSGERPADGSRSKKKLKLRSEVWEHFHKTTEGERAICKYCSKNLSGKSSGGTTHLSRHLNICDKCPKGDINQQLTKDSKEEVRNIELTQKETWPEPGVKKAILHEVPFASPDFKNGWYSSMEPMDVQKEIYAYFEQEKKNLAIELNNLTSRVCFSIQHIIEGNYLSVTAHFIDADYDLVKKLICFKKLRDFNLKSIENMIKCCLSEWKLEEKYFTFTMREFYSNEIMLLKTKDYISVHCFKERFSIFYSRSFRVLYFDQIGNPQKCVEALTATPIRIDMFNQIAKDRGLSPVNEGWFEDHAKRIHLGILDPSSVARMLKDMFIYRDVFTQYGALTETHQLSGKNSYSCIDWQRLQLILKFSERVNFISNGLSSFKYPMLHLYLRNILEIRDMIAIVKENTRQRSIDGLEGIYGLEGVYGFEGIYDLEGIYNKILEPQRKDVILFLASVLDPRYKLIFFQYCTEMGYFSDQLGKNITYYREILRKFFSEYAKKEANHDSPSLVGTINMQDQGNSLNNYTYISPTTITDRFHIYLRGRIERELDKYLREEVVDMGDADFDLLGWWKQNQTRFPVLSRMARDILAVTATVYSVEDTIKSDLIALQGVDPRLLEAVICSKDWILDREQSDASVSNT